MSAKLEGQKIRFESSFEVSGQELILGRSVDIWPSNVRIQYRMWSLDSPGYRSRTWVASVSGKCPPGSRRRSGTIEFLEGDTTSQIPDWVQKLVDENTPPMWDEYND